MFFSVKYSWYITQINSDKCFIWMIWNHSGTGSEINDRLWECAVISDGHVQYLVARCSPASCSPPLLRAIGRAPPGWRVEPLKGNYFIGTIRDDSLFDVLPSLLFPPASGPPLQPNCSPGSTGPTRVCVCVCIVILSCAHMCSMFVQNYHILMKQ